MTKFAERKVRKIGNGYYICLPIKFLAKHQIKGGDFLPILMDDDCEILKIINMKEGKK